MSQRSTTQHCHIDTPFCTIRKSHVTWNFAVPGPHSEEIRRCILLFLCTLVTIQETRLSCRSTVAYFSSEVLSNTNNAPNLSLDDPNPMNHTQNSPKRRKEKQLSARRKHWNHIQVTDRPRPDAPSLTQTIIVQMVYYLNKRLWSTNLLLGALLLLVLPQSVLCLGNEVARLKTTVPRFLRSWSPFFLHLFPPLSLAHIPLPCPRSGTEIRYLLRLHFLFIRKCAICDFPSESSATPYPRFEMRYVKGPSPITGILFQTNDVRLRGGRVKACSFEKIGIFGLLRVVLHDFPVVSVTKKSIILQTSLTGRPSWPSLSLSTSSTEQTRDLHDFAPSLALSVMRRTNGGR